MLLSASYAKMPFFHWHQPFPLMAVGSGLMEAFKAPPLPDTEERHG